MIKITFPDGSVREYNEGVTGLQIAESIKNVFCYFFINQFNSPIFYVNHPPLCKTPC